MQSRKGVGKQVNQIEGSSWAGMYLLSRLAATVTGSLPDKQNCIASLMTPVKWSFFAELSFW
jgi:hypothetical protein